MSINLNMELTIEQKIQSCIQPLLERICALEKEHELMKSQLSTMTSLKSPTKTIKDPLADKSTNFLAPKINSTRNEGSKKDVEDKMIKKDNPKRPSDMTSPNNSKKRMEPVKNATDKKPKEPVRSSTKLTEPKIVPSSNPSPSPMMSENLMENNPMMENNSMMPPEHLNQNMMPMSSNEESENLLVNSQESSKNMETSSMPSEIMMNGDTMTIHEMSEVKPYCVMTVMTEPPSSNMKNGPMMTEETEQDEMLLLDPKSEKMMTEAKCEGVMMSMQNVKQMMQKANKNLSERSIMMKTMMKSLNMETDPSMSQNMMQMSQEVTCMMNTMCMSMNFMMKMQNQPEMMMKCCMTPTQMDMFGNMSSKMMKSQQQFMTEMKMMMPMMKMMSQECNSEQMMSMMMKLNAMIESMMMMMEAGKNEQSSNSKQNMSQKKEMMNQEMKQGQNMNKNLNTKSTPAVKQPSHHGKNVPVKPMAMEETKKPMPQKVMSPRNTEVKIKPMKVEPPQPKISVKLPAQPAQTHQPAKEPTKGKLDPKKEPAMKGGLTPNSAKKISQVKQQPQVKSESKAQEDQMMMNSNNAEMKDDSMGNHKVEISSPTDFGEGQTISSHSENAQMVV